MTETVVSDQTVFLTGISCIFDELRIKIKIQPEELIIRQLQQGVKNHFSCFTSQSNRIQIRL